MMDAAELALLSDSLRQTAERSSGADLDAALEELGWADAYEVVPATAVPALFTAQGASVTTSATLGRLLALELGAGPVDAVLPPLDSARPPGQGEPGALSVRGVVLASALQADRLLVAVPAEDGGTAAATVAVQDLVQHPVRGLDPALGLVEVVGEGVRGEACPVTGEWDAAVAVGRLAVAAELLGAARTMLELARTHALDRVQFGRPISGFQAVRHRLADTLVALEAADGLLSAAWEDRSPVTAAMAKGLAGRSARTAGTHCQQVLAGIGFTTEHRFHLYLRRTVVLDQLLGSSRTTTRELGRSLLSSRRLPEALPL